MDSNESANQLSAVPTTSVSWASSLPLYLEFTHEVLLAPGNMDTFANVIEKRQVEASDHSTQTILGRLCSAERLLQTTVSIQRLDLRLVQRPWRNQFSTGECQTSW